MTPVRNNQIVNDIKKKKIDIVKNSISPKKNESSSPNNNVGNIMNNLPVFQSNYKKNTRFLFITFRDYERTSNRQDTTNISEQKISTFKINLKNVDPDAKKNREKNRYSYDQAELHNICTKNRELNSKKSYINQEKLSQVSLLSPESKINKQSPIVSHEKIFEKNKSAPKHFNISLVYNKDIKHNRKFSEGNLDIINMNEKSVNKGTKTTKDSSFTSQKLNNINKRRRKIIN